MKVNIKMSEKILLKTDRHSSLKITTRHPITKAYPNITGAELTFQIKTELNTGATILVNLKNIAAGGASTQIEDFDLTSGIYKLHITPDHLTGLDVGSTYWGETKMTLASKDETIFQRKILILPSMVD